VLSAEEFRKISKGWGFFANKTDAERYQSYREDHCVENGTVYEQLLFTALCESCPEHRFIHQFCVPAIPEIAGQSPSYRLDIYCPDQWFAIEVDGSSHHDPAKDSKRDFFLRAVGIETRRFSTQDVGSRLPRVLRQIRAELSRRAANGVQFGKNPVLIPG